jgi:hypothetical protein
MALDVPAVVQNNPALFLEDPCITARPVLPSEQAAEMRSRTKAAVVGSQWQAHSPLRIPRKVPLPER